jgi:Fe-S-cluster containining protein
MSERTEDTDPPAEPVPEWLQKLHRLREEEAVRFAGHQFDEDGWHDEDGCEICLLAQAKECVCRCAECCRRLLIEVTLLDAQREPKIRERGKPILGEPDPVNGHRDVEGYMLNNFTGHSMACVFLDEASNLCTIHVTRPLVCRLFDCEGKGRDQLIELGILPAREITESDVQGDTH